MENKGDINKLKEFLETQDTSGFDEFEKEALEGYQSLGNAQKAFELKVKTDERFNAEVIKGSSGKRTIYWAAAAALALIIGLSALFILNNREDINHNSVAAVINQEKTVAPEGLSEKEQTNTLSPMEEAVKRNSPETMKQEKAPALKQDASGAGVQSKGVYGQNKTIASGGNQQETILSETEKSTAAEAPLEDVAVNNNKDVESAAEEKPKRLESSPAGAVKATYPESSKKAKTKSAAPAAPSMAKEEIATKADSDDERKKNISIAADKESDDRTKSSCTYKGGADKLVSEIKVRLENENVNVPFEAVLYINRKKQVDEIEFTNKFQLSKDQKRKITRILKELKGFETQGQTDKFYLYKLEYKP